MLCTIGDIVRVREDIGSVVSVNRNGTVTIRTLCGKFVTGKSES